MSSRLRPAALVYMYVVIAVARVYSPRGSKICRFYSVRRILLFVDIFQVVLESIIAAGIPLCVPSSGNKQERQKGFTNTPLYQIAR